MQIRRKDVFITIRTEGALLPSDLLQRIAEPAKDIPGLDEAAYHLSGERINEAVNRAWNRLQSAWKSFQNARSELPETDLGTRITRERWLLPLFQEFGFGRLLVQKSVEIGGKPYPISHGWQHTPIHLPGFRVDLDRRMAGVAGAARMSPHSMVQEYLNRSDDHLWAFVSNGLCLRVLRDNVSLTRQAYVEFDLESMMEGEVYADFVVLWLICHQSRVEAENPAECWLEHWSKLAHDQGTRALDQLRDGVQTAIEAIGSGFLSHPKNESLREKLKSGTLDKQEYYRQILRLIYRLIFLFVAEDRDLLLTSKADQKARERYLRFYTMRRIRELAGKKIGSRHSDLFHGVRLVMEKLRSNQGCSELALPAMGSLLFSKDTTPDLEGLELGNRSLMSAVRAVSFITFESKRRPVDFKNLGSEELGSVYESLLELHPELNSDTGAFKLKTAGGHERKTTGSYYTPSSLVQCLLDSALEPVVAEALKKNNSEQAILNLKVCDPACGSGHFLVAAAHRMAKRLAAVRTGDEEPSPEATRMALRDVIGRCIYGVDINPMAVELCKVSLWLEAMDPERPLSFLDHHIQCGNSLLGTTPALLEKGIPDDAFKPIEGDDKEYCRIWKQHNKQMPLFEGKAQTPKEFEALSTEFLKVSEMDDSTLWGVKEKQASWGKATQSARYLNERMLADTWCAAFVWVKKHSKKFAAPITNVLFRKMESDPAAIDENVKTEVQRLSGQYRFFHWHLAFPDVFRLPKKGEKSENEEMGWNGGFDVVLGNPPWERLNIEDRQFFSDLRPDIASATTAKRNKLIKELLEENPALYNAYNETKRRAASEIALCQNSGLYPHLYQARINTYSLFADLSSKIINRYGRCGKIIPSGIVTDDTSRRFFNHVMTDNKILSIYDFENRKGIFPGIHRSYKFCLFTLGSSVQQKKEQAKFAFFLQKVEEIKEKSKIYSLSSDELKLLSPITGLCPTFRNEKDKNLVLKIYKNVPSFIKQQKNETDWVKSDYLIMFRSASSSHLYKTLDDFDLPPPSDIEQQKFEIEGVRYLPIWESKLIHQFDFRFATYDGLSSKFKNKPREIKLNEKDIVWAPQPKLWVDVSEINRILSNRSWDKGWLAGYRDITNATNERTAIAAILPEGGAAQPLNLFLPETAIHGAIWVSCMNSFALDYVARQSIGGVHLNITTCRQLPIISHSLINSEQKQFISSRVVELVYSSPAISKFAYELGYQCPPFKWDECRRFLIRCELDAAYFHLYGVEREDVNYIMDTFPIVKRKDEQKYEEYRTKRVILECYDSMATAIKTGRPYQTILDPPPTDPSVAHPPKEK